MVKEFFGKIFGKKLAEDAPVQIEQQTVIVKTETIGSSGSKNYGGYPDEEYLQSLNGTQRADIFDQMRRSDTQIKMVLSSVINPIKDGCFELEPLDDTPEAKNVSDLIEHILFKDMDQPFLKFISEALGMIGFGHSVFEVTHKVVIGHEKFGNYNGLRSLGWRSPRTIERWNLDKETGKLASITQNADGDLARSVDIDAKFLLVFSLDKEGSNYEGISWLRPCYGSWFRKNNYLKLNAIGIEKSAVPTPIAKTPLGAKASGGTEALKRALEIYTTHQANYLILPEGYDIDLKTNTYDPQKVEVSIDNEDARIARAFLANFLNLGNSGGSYALSNDLSDFFLSGINHIAKEICDEINQKLIPDLVKLNFPNGKAPKLKVSGISDKAGKELSEILVALGGGKWLTPSDKDESHLRKRLGLPEQSDIGVRDTKPAAQSFGFAERIRLGLEAKRK